VALTNTEKQRAYRNRKNPPTANALLLSRFKAVLAISAMNGSIRCS